VKDGHQQTVAARLVVPTKTPIEFIDHGAGSLDVVIQIFGRDAVHGWFALYLAQKKATPRRPGRL
jgi:hypothetical protein